MAGVNAQSFRKLSSVWGCEPRPGETKEEAMRRKLDAEERIRRYGSAASRHADRMGRKYNDVDWEPICFESLCIASYTWDHNRSSFFHWFANVLRGRASGHIQNCRRRLAIMRRRSLSELTRIKRAQWDAMQPWEAGIEDFAPQ